MTHDIHQKHKVGNDLVETLDSGKMHQNEDEPCDAMELKFGLVTDSEVISNTIIASQNH